MSDTNKIHFVPLPFPVMGANPLQGPMEGEGGRELLRKLPRPLSKANPLQGPMEGGGPENILFWALKWQRAKLKNIKLPLYLFLYIAWTQGF
jgi:hypothetical protein